MGLKVGLNCERPPPNAECMLVIQWPMGTQKPRVEAVVDPRRALTSEGSRSCCPEKGRRNMPKGTKISSDEMSPKLTRLPPGVG